MEKKTFKIEVRETLARVVEVSAINEAEAIALVEDMYNAETVVLDYNDIDGNAEFVVI